jgi:hypothetical protein
LLSFVVTPLQIGVVFLCLGWAGWSLLGLMRPRGARPAPRGRRTTSVARLAVALAVGLLGLVVLLGIVRLALNLTHPQPGLLDWTALVAASIAVVICLWDPAARFPLAGLYVLGLAAVGMTEIARGLSPGQLLLWGSFTEWTGFMLVTALVGWCLGQFERVTRWLRIPNPPGRWWAGWFNPAQALLATVTAVLAVWVAIDFSFDGMGQGWALFGLTGRWSACPAGLMLLGGLILMAWQTRGTWRAVWQYAAMAAGVLLTSSVGWANLDAADYAPLAREAWLDRSVTLMISAGMMTLMTGIGLPRAFPRTSEWVTRGRRAAPAFASLALLMLLAVLIQMA